MPSNRELKRRIEELENKVDNIIEAYTYVQQNLRKTNWRIDDLDESNAKLFKFLGEAIQKVLDEKE